MEIWNKDKRVLDTQHVATHEEQFGQPAGTLTILNFLFYMENDMLLFSPVDFDWTW